MLLCDRHSLTRLQVVLLLLFWLQVADACNAVFLPKPTEQMLLRFLSCEALLPG